MHIKHPIYKNFYEALDKLDLSAYISVVLISDHPKSLESIKKNTVKIIGRGNTKYPGYPAGNQNAMSQKYLLTTLIQHGQVPVLHRFQNGIVEFLGYYKHLDTNIKLSECGFRYYEYTLQRYNKA